MEQIQIGGTKRGLWLEDTEEEKDSREYCDGCDQLIDDDGSLFTYNSKKDTWVCNKCWELLTK